MEEEGLEQKVDNKFQEIIVEGKIDQKIIAITEISKKMGK